MGSCVVRLLALTVRWGPAELGDAEDFEAEVVFGSAAMGGTSACEAPLPEAAELEAVFDVLRPRPMPRPTHTTPMMTHVTTTPVRLRS